MLTFVAWNLVKEWEARPRPADGLVDAGGFELPVGARRILGRLRGDRRGRRLRLPAIPVRATLVGAAIVLAAAIGLSRVYLRAHYMSDVIAGWGMAASLFAVCGSWRSSSPPSATMEPSAMSNTSITYLVGALRGRLLARGLRASILVPAWNAYSRVWQRAAAVFLSLYVFAAFVGVGIAGRRAAIWFRDRLSAGQPRPRATRRFPASRPKL